MKLSVIVPVYNVESYLHRCIDSILCQTETDWEAILVDDGSSDHSGQICDAYSTQDHRIKTIHKTNGGQSAARNQALDIAQGDYIIFVDSDDYIDPDMFRYMLSAAKTHDADIVTCQYETITEDRTTIPRAIPEYPDTPMEHGDLMRHFYCPKDGKNHLRGVVCGKIYRRQLFDGIRFPCDRIYEDTYTIPFLYERTRRIVITCKPFYKYQTRQGSTVNSRFTAKNLDALFVALAHYQFFLNRPQYHLTDTALHEYVKSFTDIFYTVRLRHPALKKNLEPYKKEFCLLLPTIMQAPNLCRLEKISIRFMLFCPRLAIVVTKKFFPESLLNYLK